MLCVTIMLTGLNGSARHFEWQRSAELGSAVLLQGDAGALCGARLGEGSAQGSSLALWGCAELMLCNLHFVGFLH